MVFGTHWMKPHSSFRVTTPYVRMSVATLSPWTDIYRGGLLTELPPTRLGVGFQELIDDRVELHQSSILAQVVLRFTQEHVYLPIAPLDGDLARLGKRSHDLDLVEDLYSWSVISRAKCKDHPRTCECGRINGERLVSSVSSRTGRESRD